MVEESGPGGLGVSGPGVTGPGCGAGKGIMIILFPLHGMQGCPLHMHLSFSPVLSQTSHLEPAPFGSQQR